MYTGAVLYDMCVCIKRAHDTSRSNGIVAVVVVVDSSGSSTYGSRQYSGIEYWYDL